MGHDTDLARLRTTYADLLDADAPPDLVRFLGDLEALHTAPTPPAPARIARPARLLGVASRTAQPTLPPPSAPARRPWAGGVRVTTAFSTAALIVVVVAVAALLLRDCFAPAATDTASAPTGSATVLYPGTLDGRAGIVAAGADGGDPRLLTGGAYSGVAASPDGRRFLAYNSESATLYAMEGQVIRRYDLGAATPLIAYWSPDAQRVALYARADDLAAWEDGDFGVWLLDEQGARELRLGARTSVGTMSGTGVWSARGRLLLGVVPGDSNGDGRAGPGDAEELWTVDATGGDARRLYAGEGFALGWSRAGTAVYVVEPGRVLAIDGANGAARTVVTAADVARQLRTEPQANGTPPTLGAFGALSAAALAPAPDGDRLALWLVPATAVGATAAPEAPYLAVLDERGKVVGQHRAATGTTPTFTAWAPDGKRLAYSHTEAGNGSMGGVRVVTVNGAASAALPPVFTGVDRMRAATSSLRWSPDGRHLAVLRAGRIEVWSGPAPGDKRVLPGSSNGWPSWQPPAAP